VSGIATYPHRALQRSYERKGDVVTQVLEKVEG